MKKGFYIFLIIIGAALAYYSFSGASDAGYEKSVQEVRAEKEDYLRTGPESPFVISGKDVSDLSYFPIDKKYQVSARVEKMESRQFVGLANSDGTTERYLKYAWLHFELDGKKARLMVLKPAFVPGYFLGFTDLTSGKETYGGGRYIDIHELRGDRVTIDFNLAYNPYCAYDPNFTCPLPVQENYLNLTIQAGEKNYKE